MEEREVEWRLTLVSEEGDEEPVGRGDDDSRVVGQRLHRPLHPQHHRHAATVLRVCNSQSTWVVMLADTTQVVTLTHST